MCAPRKSRKTQTASSFVHQERIRTAGTFDFPVRTHLVGSTTSPTAWRRSAVGMSVLGLEPEAVQAGIAALPGIPGRMERIEMGQDFSAIVDFAHTPNALQAGFGSRALDDRRAG